MSTFASVFFRTIAGLLATAAIGASAAEITFFEYPGFGGRNITMRGYTPNFAEVGFNDRAASIVVRDGTWQVCTEANFTGNCATVTRGEYQALGSQFDGKISSAREVGTYVGNTGAYSNYRRGTIQLFSDADFRGASIQLDRDTGNFATVNFNDRAGSMVVQDGTWELCVDAEFRGACRTFGPGRYRDLGPGIARQVSSARIAGGVSEAPYVVGGYGGNAGVVAPEIGDRRAPPRTDASVRVILFEDEGFQGRSMVLTENNVNLGSTGFNDRAASAVVENGLWEVCTDAFFRGECNVLQPGRYRRLEGSYFRSVSSVRLVGGNANAQVQNNQNRANRRRADIELFEHDDFMGRRFESQVDEPNLADREFNDIASSIIVYRGNWEVCTDAFFQGRCVVFGPGRHNSVYGLNDQFSSFRRVN